MLLARYRNSLSHFSYSGGARLVRLDDDDDAFIRQTAFASKRVKVVQLLVFGKFVWLVECCVQVRCHNLTRARISP